MIQLGKLTQYGAAPQKATMKLVWNGAENTTYFYNNNDLLAKVFGRTPTDFSYADSSNGISNVYF
jgi:hypothetical protein